MAVMVILGIVAIFVIVLAARGFTIGPQAQTMVIARMGKYHKTLAPGIYIIWPIFDRPKRVE